MWRRRRRYVFRKRSMGGRILPLVVGVLVVMGLIWLMPWSTLSSAPVDEPKADALEDRPDQKAVEIEQPEQETAKARSKDENAPEATPLPKEERASNNPLPPSSPPPPPPPPPAQASLPSPPLPSPKVEEISNSFLYSSNYWDYESDYWDYDYWDYEPDDYGDYGSSYWEYWPDY